MRSGAPPLGLAKYIYIILYIYIIATAHDFFSSDPLFSGLDPVSLKGIDKQF